MGEGLKIAFFGSSLLSAYWNGAATYYRGIIKALHARGHRITFYEPNAFDRQSHRDIDPPDYARSVVYPADDEGVRGALRDAGGADIVVKASGVGIFDPLLEEEVLGFRERGAAVIFWDVDAPATLDRVMNETSDYFRSLIPEYDLVLTYGGGYPVVHTYRSLGARDCVPIYNALDPDEHHPVPPEPRFEGTLGFLGNRMPDREQRVWEFFFKTASSMPGDTFLLGGSGWESHLPEVDNIVYLGHVYTRDHNAFNCSVRAVLNISRQSMAQYGFSPATRVFEAAGAGVCMITDEWEGIDLFFEPGVECLVARSGEDVVRHLEELSTERALEIGRAAYRRVLADHTYRRRAEELEHLLYSVAEGKGVHG